MAYLKGYMKKVREWLQENKPERVEGYKKGAQDMAMWINSNFDEFSFYSPESYDMENSIILSYYKEDAETPTFVYFSDGLKTVIC